VTAPIVNTVPNGIGPQPPGTFRCDAPKRSDLNAIRFLDAFYKQGDGYKLVCHRGKLYRWTDTHWREMDEGALHSQIYATFERAVYVGRIGTGANALPAWVDFEVDNNRAKLIAENIKSKLYLDRDTDVPCWFEPDENVAMESPPVDARDMIACQNGIVHAMSRQLWAHTPRLYNHYAVTYDFSPEAPAPRGWFKFLHEVWPDDPDSVATLQEIFGYLLTYRTDLQTMFMMVGPPRCGKGTIIRVLTALLGGDHNVGSVSLADLNQRFGLEGIETKGLAVMQDTRFRSRDDGVAVERLLSITGEDPVSVEKKGQPMYSSRLPTRFMLVSNEVPKMQDESGALRSRMLMLKFTNEIPAAKRDANLTGKLLGELPGILMWALDGLDRLVERTRFAQPKSAAEGLDLLANLGSTTKLFLEEMCRIDPMAQVVKADLFAVYRQWCETKNIRASNEVHFGRDLHANIPHLDGTGRVTVAPNKRATAYRGLELNMAGQAMLSRSAWVTGL